MTAVIDRVQTEAFRGAIHARVGLHYDDDRLEFLADVLRQRLAALGLSHGDRYLELLGSERGPPEFRALAEVLTVGETFFFRNADQFRAFTEVALPERVRARAPERRIRILSAGCASGDEPYSLAMLASQQLPQHAGWDVRINALDLNRASLARAAEARYSPWALRATADDVRDRYFKPSGRDFVLDPAIRDLVAFEERNLAAEDPLYWQGLGCDVVFCRNVLMYFSPEVMARVVRRLTQALLPGGYLFLGHAETLRGLSQDFHLCHTHETFYYRRRDAADPHFESSEPFPSRISRPSALPAMVDSTVSWVDVIQRASERITLLAASRGRDVEVRGDSAPAPLLDASSPAAAQGWDLALILDLMKQERFVDALALLGALPPESLKDPDTLLLRAILLANSGRLDESERLCRELLVLDELNAGAHYLVALCREHAADAQGAFEHDQTAAYLDTSFAMPHLHQGLMARRAGDAPRARRELALAQILLVREDAPRILLFGGGFSREMLMGLCRAELSAVGETS